MTSRGFSLAALDRLAFSLPLSLCLLLLLPLMGCAKSGASGEPSKGSSSEASDKEETREGDEKKEDDEPFESPTLEEPPTLEEIDAGANWIDQKVADGRQLLRGKLANQKPLVTEKQALSMKNSSEEDNAKIYSVFRRLPENDDQVDWDATFNHHTKGAVKSLNPLMISAANEMELLELTGLQLLAFDADFTPFAPAWAVKSWQTSEDHLIDKFVLRDDLTWSDDKPLTAYDFEFSYQTIMNKKVAIPAVRSAVVNLRGVKAYDAHTLVMFQKKAMGSWTENIQFPVIPKHIYEKSLADDYSMEKSEYHRPFINKPVTCGPYEYTSRVQGREIVLSRREGYYMKDKKQIRPKPFFKQIRLKIIIDPNTTLLSLKSGKIDDCRLTADQWLTQTKGKDFYKRNTKLRGLEWTSYHFVWNTQRPYFSDQRVREAMAYTFDHQEMLSTIFFDLAPAGRGPFHPAGWMASKNPVAYQQDLDKAEDLLDAAGWDDSDGDGYRDKWIDGKLVPFEFTLLSQTSPNAVNICTLMKENLDRVGIICHVKQTEYVVLQEKETSKQFDAAMGGWGTGTDPATLDSIFKTGADRNYGSYSNKRVDELFELAQAEFDRDKRAVYYAEMHDLLWEEKPYLWLFYRPTLFGINNKIRGFNFSPRDPYGVSPGLLGLWKTKE